MGILEDTKLIEITQFDLNKKRAESMYAGEASAYEEFAEWLRQRSGWLFAQGKEEEAKIVRSLSFFADEKGKASREAQKKYA